MGGATNGSGESFGGAAFQSTLPVGGATFGVWVVLKVLMLFQSTLPVGGATCRRKKPLQYRQLISIHAPRGGSDQDSMIMRSMRPDFNPRSPWGERLDRKLIKRIFSVFQSTLPVGGATTRVNFTGLTKKFQSTLPVGGATRQEAD